MPVAGLVSTNTSWPGATSSATEAGRQADAIFMNLDFLRHTDAHDEFAPIWEVGGPIAAALGADCSAFLPVLVRARRRYTGR